MQILAHRGLWTERNERNSLAALDRAFAAGYGAETDVRDFDGELVIAHDPPSAGALRCDDFLGRYVDRGRPGTLALNVKADGLQTLLRDALADHGVENYFVFDMSAPETVRYRACGMPFFTRQSEYEFDPLFLQDAVGVWLDAFQAEWYSPELIEEHLSAGRRVAVVSPELHGRPHLDLWNRLLRSSCVNDRVLLCTDFPDDAAQHFGISAQR